MKKRLSAEQCVDLIARTSEKLFLEEIEQPKKVYPKVIYDYIGILRHVTLCGIVDIIRGVEIIEKPTEETINGKKHRAVTYIKRPWKKKRLRVGYAICHPEDAGEHYSVRTGNDIAYSRAKHNPLVCLTSDFMGEFDDKFVIALMRGKVSKIQKMIDKYEKNEGSKE